MKRQRAVKQKYILGIEYEQVKSVQILIKRNGDKEICER